MDKKIKCVDAGTACESCEDCPYNNECLAWNEIKNLRSKLSNQEFISRTMTDGLIRASELLEGRI